nr:unnamed protein product [Callosobruchus chinensis]
MSFKITRGATRGAQKQQVYNVAFRIQEARAGADKKIVKVLRKAYNNRPKKLSNRVPVPEVYRGRNDALNITGHVLAKSDDELYQIGTKNENIKH